MSNYTTQTAALKAVTIDTRLLDAKQIDTKKLFVNGSTLEEVILQTSPKGINNAVRFSTTIGSIKDKEIQQDEWYISINGGTFCIQNLSLSGTWQVVQLVINRSVVSPHWEVYDWEWDCQLWEDGDDLSQIYGGINDNTVISILVAIHEQWDGDEPVRTSLDGSIQHNIVYHLGEETTLNLSLPTNLVANYSAEVVFTSGATPTVVTSDDRIKWVGDDVNNGVFTPIANVRYSCSLQYDGVFVRGMTFGIPTV